jgi:hypothetical protein
MKVKKMPRIEYEIKSGPQRTSFAEYAAHAKRDFSALLSRNPTELEIQKFLERHPSLVPGARTPSYSTGHLPLHCALITQPLLPGFHCRVPDFMWIAVHSGTWYPTLIEIEDPEKKLFTRNNQQTSEFSQAKNQLDE